MNVVNVSMEDWKSKRSLTLNNVNMAAPNETVKKRNRARRAVVHQGAEVVQGVDAGQPAGLDQAGQDIAHVGTVLIGVEQAVFR